MKASGLGQTDKAFTVLVVDPDEALQRELLSLGITGMQVVFLDQESVSPVCVQMAQADVLVIAVDSPAGLSLVADVCGRASMPPVIAVSGAGFGGKSIEHVLLLAEARGAAAALVKPLEATELSVAARNVAAKRSESRPQQKGQKNASRAPDTGDQSRD